MAFILFSNPWQVQGCEWPALPSPKKENSKSKQTNNNNEYNTIIDSSTSVLHNAYCTW